MAKARAKELQAAAVVLYGSNPQSVTQQVPVLDLSGIADVLNPPKTTTTTSGTIYGSGGSVGYNQTSTTTAPPTRKQPRTVEESYVRYDQLAMFWAKAKPRRLGVDLRDLDDDDRMRLGGNRGMRVDAVVKGSPAFLGDMLRGDIVTAIDDVPIRQESDVTAFLAQHSGKEVSVHVVRRDEKMTLRVRLGD
jgi:membrane-associated protease RseP (regulator of RpoE activity)